VSVAVGVQEQRPPPELLLRRGAVGDAEGLERSTISFASVSSAERATPCVGGHVDFKRA
jgi:hypothetical protein